MSAPYFPTIPFEEKKKIKSLNASNGIKKEGMCCTGTSSDPTNLNPFLHFFTVDDEVTNLNVHLMQLFKL